MNIFFSKQKQLKKQIVTLIKDVCTHNSNSIVVGEGSGHILDTLLQTATSGNHYIFEALPHKHGKLVSKYNFLANCNIEHLALGNTEGVIPFKYPLPNPKYSKSKNKSQPKEIIHTIDVATKPLDNAVPQGFAPTFVIINTSKDTHTILEGAQTIINQSRPTILFKHNRVLHSNISPGETFQLLRNAKLRVTTLDRWLKYRPCLSAKEYDSLCNHNEEYFFIAYP